MSEGERTTRRDFLRGKTLHDRATDAMADEVAGAESPSGQAGKPDLQAGTPAEYYGPDESYLLHVSRRAMACEFQVFFNAGQYLQATETGLAALDLVDAMEAQLTVYRPDSEVSCINRRAPVVPIAVEPRLFALLRQAARLSADTGGAYDITSGPLSKVWGFFRREGSIPQQSDLDAALATVGSRHLRFDDGARTLQFDQPGVEINLGSIGKGYTLDRCRELLLAAGIEDFLIHGGQSSVLAHGSRGGWEEMGTGSEQAPANLEKARNREVPVPFSSRPRSAASGGWLVGLKHPLRPMHRLAEIRLNDQALGTSGSGAQFFLHQGRRYGHILDPRTGWPAEGVLSATVVAPTAAEADSLSTAFYVLGVERSLEYCRARPELAVAIATAGSHGHRIKIHTQGFAPDAFRVLGHVS